jgi:hypothetical protein
MIALLAATILISQAEIDLHPKLEVDDQLLYRVAQKSEFAWDEPSTDANKPDPVHHTAAAELDCDIRLTILGTTAEGAAVISGVFEHLILKQSLDGAEPVAVTISGPGIEPRAAAPTEPTPIHEIAAAITESILRFDLAPDGSITMLSGLDRAWGAAEKHGREGDRLLGPFSSAAAKLTLSSILRIDPEPPGGGGRAIGDSWPIMERLAGPRFGTMVQQTIWTLDAVEGSTARLRGRTDFILRPPDLGRSDPTAPVVSLKEAVGTASATWDTIAGRLVKREHDRRVTVEAVLQGADAVAVLVTTAASGQTIERIEKPRE